MKKTLKKIGSFVGVMIITSMLLIPFSTIVNADLKTQGGSTPGLTDQGGSASNILDQGGTKPASSASTEVGTKPPDNLDTNGPYVPLDPTAYGDFAQLSQTTPTGMLNEFVEGLVMNMKYILGAVAILYIVFSAIKLIIVGDNEESVTKQKTAITMGIIGLALVMMSDEFAKVLSVACEPGEINCARGGFLSDPSNMIQQAGLFKQATRVLITFIKYLIGSIAVIMFVRNGVRFVALAGNEESVGLDKKDLAFSSIGLILIIIASTVIDKVLYIVDITTYSPSSGVKPAISPDRGMQELVGITNFVVNLVAPIAILILIIGAVMYATAGGNEDQTGKAKRLIMLAIGGMVLIYGAFAIISTVVSGQFIP